MKTLKIYESKDLKNFADNVAFHISQYSDFNLTEKTNIEKVKIESIDKSAEQKVLFSEALNKTTDVDLLELNNSYSNGISKKEQEIQKLEQQIKDAKKRINHFKKQHAKIKEAKTFVEAFEILMKD